MCGIAGAIGHLEPKVDDAVRRMADSMVHRGPDGSGVFRSHGSDFGPGVHFAHRRLAIIDLSADGRQPMSDPATGNVVCFNGEIYNYRELRNELTAAGLVFHTASDTEVLLKSYALWGDGCVAHLRGMFAFALFDKASGRTLLARDRLGIKPLYYCSIASADDRHVLLFSSEVRALLSGGMVGRRLNPDAIATYLWNGYVSGSETIIAGIRAMEPGVSMWVHASGNPCDSHRYWRLPSANGPPADEASLRAALLEATAQHMVSDVPLGVFLSGGVDSGAVAALAAASSPTRLRTFTITFNEKELDESRWARSVADSLGTEHHEILLTQQDFRSQIHEALECLDQPTFDAINTYVVSRAVRAAGMTVALSGAGGDELFGGYASFRDVPRARTLTRLARFVPRPAARAFARLVNRLMNGPEGAVPPQTRWGKLGDLLCGGSGVLDVFQASYSLFTRDFRERLSRDHATNSGAELGLHRDLARRLRDSIKDEPILHAIALLELGTFVGERLLRDTDMASMRNSLEVRVPLLDHVVVETAARIPERRRFHPVRSKRLLRDIALGALDPALFDRPKMGFVLPLEAWSKDALAGEMSSTFADTALCSAAGLDADAVNTLWGAYRQGAPGLYWSRVWALFALLHWVRRQGAELA